MAVLDPSNCEAVRIAMGSAESGCECLFKIGRLGKEAVGRRGVCQALGNKIPPSGHITAALGELSCARSVAERSSNVSAASIDKGKEQRCCRGGQSKKSGMHLSLKGTCGAGGSVLRTMDGE